MARMWIRPGNRFGRYSNPRSLSVSVEQHGRNWTAQAGELTRHATSQPGAVCAVLQAAGDAGAPYLEVAE